MTHLAARVTPKPTMPSTDDAEGGPIENVDTLTAADVEHRVSLDDELLGRDLKARMFGKRGAVLIGRYEVLSRIGRGGMGTVYLARDTELDRKIALKILRADRKHGQQRMLNEARALARLAHPNVVTVHEVGTHDGRVFLAMEFIDGRTLRAWLREDRSAAEILEVFAQAASGLAAAHSAGLVHRDFKPENVLIGDDGRVRVVDFGVAKTSPDDNAPAGSASPDSLDLTDTGQLLGTPAYMAAEQFLGLSVDGRADVFALCVALHEAFAGERPFDGDDPVSVGRAVTQGHARPLESDKLPRSLAPLLQRGLSPDRDDRPTLDDLLVELRPHLPRASRVRRALPFLGGAVAAAVTGFAVVGALQSPASTPIASNGPEVAAFERLSAAVDDAERISRAEEFLARFGESSDPARRAVAHAAIGAVLWRRSCDETWLGLCVELQSFTKGPRCGTPTRGPFVRRKRAVDLVDDARSHFTAVGQLAGIERPDDDALADAWNDAVGMSLVRLADAGMESYLSTTLPNKLDFAAAEELSTSAFSMAFDRITMDGSTLVSAYRQVKGTTPQWELVAGVRTALIQESIANVFASLPPPTDMEVEEREAYCAAVDERVVAPQRELARGVYQWCVNKAASAALQELDDAKFCAERLAP